LSFHPHQKTSVSQAKSKTLRLGRYTIASFKTPLILDLRVLQRGFNQHGALLQWLELGPIRRTYQPLLQITNPGSLLPKKADVTGIQGKVFVWKKRSLHPKSPSLYVAQAGVYYFATYLFSPQKRKVRLILAHSLYGIAQIKQIPLWGWLNQKVLKGLQNRQAFSVIGDTRKTTITLQKGWNRLLLKAWFPTRTKLLPFPLLIPGSYISFVKIVDLQEKPLWSLQATWR